VAKTKTNKRILIILFFSLSIFKILSFLHLLTCVYIVWATSPHTLIILTGKKCICPSCNLLAMVVMGTASEGQSCNSSLDVVWGLRGRISGTR
jgi:hypothetical protein